MKISEIRERSDDWMMANQRGTQQSRQMATISRIQDRQEEKGSFLDEGEVQEADDLEEFQIKEEKKWLGSGWGYSLHFRAAPDYNTAPRPRGASRGNKLKIRNGF